MTRSGLRIAFATSAAVGVAVAVAALTHHFMKEATMPLVHKLEFQLLLAGAGSENHQYLLSEGTSFY